MKAAATAMTTRRALGASLLVHVCGVSVCGLFLARQNVAIDFTAGNAGLRISFVSAANSPEATQGEPDGSTPTAEVDALQPEEKADKTEPLEESLKTAEAETADPSEKAEEPADEVHQSDETATVQLKPEPAPKPEVPETKKAAQERAEKKAAQKLAQKKQEARKARGNSEVSSRASRGASGASNHKARVVFNPTPPYPQSARSARATGVVIMRVRVTRSGSVSSVRVLRGTGRGDLDSSAARTVRNRWRFKPAMLGGVAVASVETVRVSFRLR